MSETTEERTKEALAIAERALKDYAKPSNWHPDSWGVHAVYHGNYANPPQRAANALKRIEKLTASEDSLNA